MAVTKDDVLRDSALHLIENIHDALYELKFHTIKNADIAYLESESDKIKTLATHLDNTVKALGMLTRETTNPGGSKENGDAST